MKFTGVFLCDFNHIKQVVIYVVALIVVAFVLLLIGSYIIPNINFSKTFFSITNEVFKAQDIVILQEDIIKKYNIFNKKNYAMYTDKEKGIVEYGLKKASSIEEVPIENIRKDDEIDYTSELDRGKKPTTIEDGISESTNKTVQKFTMNNMAILNYTDNRNIDFAKLFKKNIVLTKKNDNILLYHTHTSEAYSQSEGYKFDYTGTYRTTDPKFNMINIGDILEKSLTMSNFSVIHDTTPHDYGSYENAYAKSKITIQNDLEKYKNFGIVIDVHRDAFGDLTKKVSTQINGKEVSQLMFVMGIGTKGYENPYWEDNLSLALQIQKLANDMYPGLFRAMIVRNSKYNQDLNKYSMLMEVGTTGNTVEESTLAMKYFSKVMEKFYTQ